jgi:transposase
MTAKNVISVGCDSHEKTLVNLIAVNREPAEQFKVGNTRRGRQKLIALLHAKAEQLGGARIVLAYEASSQGFILYDELKASGIECYVLAPTKIERSHQQKLNKNDKKDGKRLLDMMRAHILAGSELPAVWVPEVQTRDDRETVRTRHDLTEKQTAVKTQIQMLLKRWGIEKPNEVGGSRSKRYRQWLIALAQETTRAVGFRTALSSLIRQLEFQEAELQHVDESIADLCEKPHLKPIVEALDAESGVGRLAAVTYATEVGDFTRFRRRQQIAAYWGVTPSSNESGEIQDRKGHITRHGSPRVRRILCQSHWVRVKQDAHEREVYRQLIAKNPKRKKIAVVAGMRRLSVRLWHVGRQAQLRLKALASK